MKPGLTYTLFVIFLLITPWMGFAQNIASGEGTTEIIQDARVDLLVSKHIRINKTIKTIDGFRIQLFSDSGNNSKTKAQSLQDELMARFPAMGVFLSFKSPNYKVRMGDFRTRLDAQRFLNEITIDFPNAFIVSDQINLPKSD